MWGKAFSIIVAMFPLIVSMGLQSMFLMLQQNKGNSIFLFPEDLVIQTGVSLTKTVKNKLLEFENVLYPH